MLDLSNFMQSTQVNLDEASNYISLVYNATKQKTKTKIKVRMQINGIIIL
jgi:hypothetical protein